MCPTLPDLNHQHIARRTHNLTTLGHREITMKYKLWTMDHVPRTDDLGTWYHGSPEPQATSATFPATGCSIKD